ncbi:MAG: DUF2029 domain-containing protein [Holophagales bacterium]|nr:DUF2029 domain-containing protein [Holophagales bacterium]
MAKKRSSKKPTKTAPKPSPKPTPSPSSGDAAVEGPGTVAPAEDGPTEKRGPGSQPAGTPVELEVPWKAKASPLWDEARPWAAKLISWNRSQVATLVRRILWAAVAVCAVALFEVWEAGFPHPEEVEVKVKGVLAVATLLLFTIRVLEPPQKVHKRQAGTALALAAFLSVVGYYNFGATHGRVFVHHWEQFHYSLNSKYFPELGYDGLYAASVQAQAETYPDERIQPVIRDLRTNEIVPTYSDGVMEHRLEVKERFSPDRWRSFVRDNRHFLDANTRGYLLHIRRDHGYNPPPSWTFVARIFSSWMPLDASGLGFLGFLDIVLLGILFTAIFHTFGTRVGCVALVIFGLCYAGRFYWVGGAFLREDWLTAVGLGICLLEKRRYRWAGVCFGYAAAVRIFPVLFLVGPAVLGLRALLRRDWKWAREVALGFALTLGLAVGLGCLAGRGPSAWVEFADAISLHRQTWLTNNVGLENVILYEKQDWDRELVDFSLPEPWMHWQTRMTERQGELAGLTWTARLLMLGLLALAAWRARPSEGSALSLSAVFAMVLTTCYYWQALLVLAVLRSTPIVYGVLLVNLGMYYLHFESPAFELRYGLFSWGLLLVFLAILLPRAWRTLRTRAPDPETA